MEDEIPGEAQPVSVTPITPTSPTPEKKASASKQPDASSPDEVLQFQADDLSAIFGS